MNWEAVLRLMKNPLFREFADIAIQNRDVVSDMARKWGARKQRPEAESAAGFDAEDVARETATAKAAEADELRGRVAVLEATLVEGAAAAEAARTELESRIRQAESSIESLGARAESAEARASSLEHALQQALSRVSTVEADAARRTRIAGIAAAVVAAWSVGAAIAVHYLLR